MNYLKSITTSVLQSAGVTFPFSIGERIPGLDSGSSIWEIREGVKRDDGTPLTLFIYDSTLPPYQPGNKDRKTLFQLAKNALKKTRTIRHPDVIKYIDSVETETHIYIATERVRPLTGVLREWETGGSLAGPGTAKGKGKEEWIGWGVKSISTALAFLNSPPLSQHHAYLIPAAVFVTPSLEWRLGGFDLLTGRDDQAGVLWGLGGVAPGDVRERSGPEVKKGGWGVLRDTDPALSDTYLLALLIFTLYNPLAPLPSLNSPPTPSSAGSIPKSLYPLWKRLLNPNPRTRLSTSSFVEEATSSGFWASNPLVSLVGGLDNFELASEGDKLGLLRIIKDASNSGTLPAPFTTHKILPSLLHSLSLPTAPSSAMLPLVLELGKLVPPSDYPKVVLEPVVKLYTSPDRGTRMALLDGLNEYADKMDNKMVQEKVWPNLITGFADTVPVIREATVKAVFPLAGKLSDRILNNDLLRLLAKMQMDTEPSIRTNTCILLGRLAPSLGPNTKKKVLVPAFARSLKDPFVHARVAGLMALMATVECFDREDLAGKVVPNMAFTLVDKEKLVRDQAFKAMSMFMGRITEMVKNMPDTVLAEEKAASSYGPVTTTSSTTTNNQAGLANSAAGAAGALAGWAISSLSKQLSTPELHTSMSAASALNVPSGSPNPSNGGSPLASPRISSDSASMFTSTTSPSVPGPSSGRFKSTTIPKSGSASGLKLGGKKPTAGPSSLADVVASEWDDDDNDAGNAWGNDDLIDVNADEDDWSAFESAPVPEIVVPPPQSYYITSSKPSSNLNGSSKQTPPLKPSPVSAFAQTKSPLNQSVTSMKSPQIPASPAIKSPALSTTATDDWGDVEQSSQSTSPQKQAAAAAPSLAGMSKEEKEKEMARRRAERQARINAMKEQKKGKA
ncbi:uncharacterized protein IL334_007320 [Kwoniella shivajii]|uniref:Protein kinase domain-containing protein n=1 Tax=Kwoniella shivajii TaxID=564305 RepID=A0ABZ1D9Q7_9TREE|nr:hypothetical protein IL334_007320 [Kwoniella shivajii]